MPQRRNAATPQRRNAATPQRRIDLDFVRGVAILLAMGWHFNRQDTGLLPIDLLQWPGRTFGWAGVDLFFVLSGFLVGGLIFEEHRATGSFDAKRFLIRRAFKIWPVMYFYVALVVVTGRYAWTQVVPQTLFHVQNYFATPLNHLWSLAVEEHFYLAAAFLFAAWARRPRTNRSAVPAVLLGVMLVVPLLRAAGVAAGFDARALQWQTQFRIDALACGMLLAHWRVREPAWFAGLAARKLACALVTAAAVAYLAWPGRTPAGLAVYGYTVVYLGAAAFLLFVYDLPAVNRHRSAAWLAWIGSYSYPMYLLQFVMLRAGEALWRRVAAGPVPAWLELAFAYLGAIALAVVVSRTLERPMLALRNRLFPSQAEPRAAGAVAPAP